MQASRLFPLRIFASPRAQAAAWVLAGLAALAAGWLAVFRRLSDFHWHLNLGQSFLAGEPYRFFGDWYTPARAMFNGLLALLPPRLAAGLVYLAALAGLYVSYRIWRTLLVPQPTPDESRRLRSAALVTVLVIFPYVLRDLDECGLQLLLLFMLSMGAWCVWKHHDLAAGLWLAAAAVYKTTPVLFLPLLLFKRRWRAAGWMAAGVVGLNLLPAVHLGWSKSIDCNRQFLARMQTSLAIEDPLDNGIEPTNPRNLGLTAALARYLQHYPSDYPVAHAAHTRHPLFFQFGDLAPLQSKRVIQVVLLALAGLLAWRMRGGWNRQNCPQDDAASFSAEWAAVCLLCALLSPMCWKHHLVLGLPCIFIVAHRAIAASGKARLPIAVLCLIATVALVTRRFFLGVDFSLVAISYKPDTVVMLLTMFTALFWPSRLLAAGEAALSRASDADLRPRQAA